MARAISKARLQEQSLRRECRSKQVIVPVVNLDDCWRLAYVPRRPARFVLEIAPVHLPDFKVGDEVLFEEKPLD